MDHVQYEDDNDGKRQENEDMDDSIQSAYQVNSGRNDQSRKTSTVADISSLLAMKLRSSDTQDADETPAKTFKSGSSSEIQPEALVVKEGTDRSVVPAMAAQNIRETIDRKAGDQRFANIGVDEETVFTSAKSSTTRKCALPATLHDALEFGLVNVDSGLCLVSVSSTVHKYFIFAYRPCNQ